MKGNPKRPPWSQPICQACYVKRFGSKCRVFSPWTEKEFCFDCAAVTSDGIYIDIRDDAKVRGAHGVNQQERQVAAWIKEHGEYRDGAVRGSAEGDGDNSHG